MLFKEVVGQGEIKKKLIQDVKSGQVPHAHLFTGNTGFGGLPLALAFAQYLMCENKQEHDSCGACSGCRRVQKLEHLDLHFSFPTVQSISQVADLQFKTWKDSVLKDPYLSLNDWISISDEKGRKPIISVHESREIVKKLTLKSFSGGYKVSVIWLAEEMNTGCANKLLKIIEEPPENTVFILIASSEVQILPTILSRTQITQIKPLKDEDIIAYFQTQKGITDKSFLKSVSARSEGSLSAAKGIIEAGETTHQNFTFFVEMMRLCYQKNVPSMMDWASQLSKLGREDQKQFLEYAIYMLRQSMVNNYTKGKLLNAGAKEVEFLSKFSRFITNNNIEQFHQLFNDSHYNINRNGNSKIIFTTITFEVMRYIHRA